MNTLNTVTLNQLWVILLGRKGLLLSSLIMIVLIGVISTLVMPKTYTAVSSVSFDIQGSNPYANVGFGNNEASFIATSVEILNSKSLGSRVFDSLTDEEIIAVAESIFADRTLVQIWLDDFFAEDAQPALPSDTNVRRQYAWVAKALVYRLTVKPVVGSRVIELYYESTDKEVASLLANRYAQAFIDNNLETITNPADRTKAWFEERLTMLKANVDKAQQELNTYQRQEGIVAVDERFDLENKKLLDLNSQLSQAQDRYRAMLAKSRQAQRTVEAGGSLESLPEVLSSATVQNIKSVIRQKESALAELSNKLGVNHPQYQRVQAEIDENRIKLKREMENVIAGLDNQVTEAKRQVGAVERELQAQKKKVLAFKTQRGQIDVLNQQLERAKGLYNSVVEQYNSANLTSLVSQANVSIVDWAQAPSLHSGPNMVKNVVLSVVVGLMFGVFVVFLMEMLDRRIRTKEDLQFGLELPVLGVLRSA